MNVKFLKALASTAIIAVGALLSTGCNHSEQGYDMTTNEQSPTAAENTTPQPSIKPMTQEQLDHHSVKIAAVQINGNWIWKYPQDSANDAANLLLPYIDRAGKDGADIVAFPELYLGMFRVPSIQTNKIAEAAKRNNIYVMVGCFEITDEEGNYGNSYLIFDRQGEIVGRYFKAYQAVGGPPNLWPPIADDPEWMMQPGQDVPVFDLDFGRIGILTCYDGYFPELFRLLSLKGAEIIFWPNARGGSVEDYIVRTNIHHNYTHTVAINKAVGAGTQIAAWPTGTVTAITEPKEDYIIAELPMDNLRNARKYSREFHQRRAALAAELAKEWPVWEQYGLDINEIEIPKPDRETHEWILNNIGEEFTKPEETE